MAPNALVSWQYNLTDQELNILNKCSVFSRTALVSVSILSNGNSSGYSFIGKVMKRRNNPSGEGDCCHMSWVSPAQSLLQKKDRNLHDRQQIRTPFSLKKDVVKLVFCEFW